MKDEKKKIAIVSNTLLLNGATKSLLDLLSRIDKNLCDIDLYVLSKKGDVYWEQKIPQNVRIIEMPTYQKDWNILKIQLMNYPIHFFKAVLAGRNLKKNIKKIKYMKYTARRMPKIHKKYDIAISYRHHDIDVFYVKENIQAKKKYFWIHGIQSFDENEKKYLRKVYSSYNGAFSVSIAAKENILRIFPELKDKIKVAYSVVDDNEIKQLSAKGEKLVKNKNVCNIVTVSRLSYEKGIHIAVEACKLVKDRGYNVKWYIIGDGPERKELEKMVNEYNLNGIVIFLGEMKNPYGFMGTCDIYVQPSLMEGYGLTINEAKILNSVIVCSNIPAAQEQIENGKNGFLVDVSADKFAGMIINLIDNKSLVEKVKKNLMLEENSHFEAVKIFNELRVGHADIFLDRYAYTPSII